MNYRLMGLLASIILPGVFVYLIGAFLMSTFDINLWYDGQRFLAVVAYMYLLSLIGQSFSETNKKEKNKHVDKKEENVKNKEEYDSKIV